MTTKNPTTQQAPTAAQTGQLLSAEQKAVCEQIAAGDSLDSRRARALLAIDGGATQVEAGRQAGLTRGQMQYCLRKFRQQGLTFFADAAPEPIPHPEPASEPAPTPALEPEPVAGDGGAERMVEKPRSKAGDKTGKGKKATRKKKKSGKKKKDGKKGRKSKSAKSSRKKDRKSKSPRKKKKNKGAKKGKRKSKR